MITNEEAEEIRKRLNNQDRMILDICIETGLRISDVLNLKLRDLGKVMYVREMKTGKHKAVEVGDELATRLNALKKRRIVKDDDRFNFAFISTRKPLAHLNRSTYHRHLKNAARGTHVDCSAHSARKLYARNVYDQHKDIFEVQKALNHKYITTTAAYMDLDIVELIRDALSRGRAT